MPADKIFFVLYWGYAAVLTLDLSLLFVTHTVYDMKQVHYGQQKQKQPYARRYKIKPLITVIIIADSEHQNVIRSIKSIISGRYRKYRIVVVAMDNDLSQVSSDVEFIRKRYPKQDISYQSSTNHSDLGKSVHEILKAYKTKKNELVLPFYAGYLLEPHTLTKIAEQFAYRKNIAALKLAASTQPLKSLSSHFLGIETAIANSNQKKLSMLYIKSITGLAPGSVVRRSVFEYETNNHHKKLAGTYKHSQFSEEARLISDKSGSFFPRLIALDAIRIPVAVMAVYYALILQIPLAIAIIWALECIYGGFALWSDSGYKRKFKLWATSLLPAWYLYSLIAKIFFVLKLLSVHLPTSTTRNIIAFMKLHTTRKATKSKAG